VKRPVDDAGQTDKLKQLLGPLAAVRLVGAADLEPIGDVFADRQVREQRQRLEHHAELALVRRHVGEVLAIEQYASRRRRFEAGDQPQQRGLAAARRPEQADELAVRRREVDVVDGLHGAERLGDSEPDMLAQPVKDQPAHARPSRLGRALSRRSSRSTSVQPVAHLV
jgi:beta-glucosidase-like glycosyl hydrolase